MGEDLNQSQRKKDHIEMANRAQVMAVNLDGRFNYEPLFFKHPESEEKIEKTFLGRKLNYPFWVSSMTGGTEHALTINQNLARLCGTFGLGMGLGSCRSLLTSSERLKDFAVRPLMKDQPLYANLGIAQVEECLENRATHQIHEMIKKIEADGLIIHLNPLQEWFQPEGDRFKVSPLETIKKFLDEADYPIIIKEVGHGMGPKSLATLLKLPLKAIEFGAFGGTNFTLLENMRGENKIVKAPFINVGHTATEMVEILNALPKGDTEFIISGGIRNVLDGYELLTKLKAPAVIGMAQAFLNPALESYESLEKFFHEFKESFLTAKGLLTIKEEK